MKKRLRRSATNILYAEKQCPLEYCRQMPKGPTFSAVCTIERKCPNRPNKLPSCWYTTGTTSGNYQEYLHFFNSELSCLPACNFMSDHPDMPTVAQVGRMGKMCDWIAEHGRCPDFIPWE